MNSATARVRRKVSSEPSQLRRVRAQVDIAVQRDHVPAGDVEAIVAASRRPGRRAEVCEVSRGVRDAVVVIARRRSCARAVSPP
jgi:hypothetical protein